MCLITNQTHAVKTWRPIICYKTVRVERTETGRLVFRSLYYDYPYRLGKTYSCVVFDHYANHGAVENGFHSYAHERDALQQCMGIGKVLLKCRIPRGALMYKGRGFCFEYCSDRIEVLGWRSSYERSWRMEKCLTLGERIRERIRERRERKASTQPTNERNDKYVK